MLITDVVVDGVRLDVRVTGGTVTALGDLTAEVGESVVPGRGGQLLPGLADHHLHLRALAAARASVDVSAGLGPLLEAPADGWVRGVGLTGDPPPTRADLDALRPSAPVRLQHRSGALWVLNSAALDALALPRTPTDGVDLDRGWLWRRDDLLAGLPRLGDLVDTCAGLLALGLTHLTDATPDLPPVEVEALRAQVPQHLLLLGDPAGPGPAKVVLPDHDLPGFDALCDRVRALRPRAVAVHSVTAASLALLVAMLEEVGVVAGDRVEHAAVCPPDVVAWLADRGVAVVTQPSIPGLRAEAMAREVEAPDRPDLWRHRSLLDAGAVVACSSDAPYGELDPWRWLSPQRPEAPDRAAALAGWLRDPLDLHRVRRVEVGAPADLVLRHDDDRRQVWLRGQPVA